MPYSETQLRSATQEDVPFLLELRRETMHPHVLASGLVPSEEHDARRVLFRFDCAQIIMLAGEPVGLLKLLREGTDWYLSEVQLKPSLQKQGLGTQLVQSVITDAQLAGASVRLDVLKSNPARRLYQRLGFTVISETPIALEMRWKP
jgi:ribosomal protein S18 acetylase RimI-like enzyme